MDTSTITELINAFKELGGETKEVFTYYLLLEYGLNFISTLIFYGLVVFTVYTVCNLIRSVFRMNSMEEKLGKAFNIKRLYNVDGFHWSNKDIMKACEILEKNKQD